MKHALLLLTALLLAPLAVSQAAETDRPNIVIILADDFGVGDIQAHYPANKIPTPHLDRLVRQPLDNSWWVASTVPFGQVN